MKRVKRVILGNKHLKVGDRVRCVDDTISNNLDYRGAGWEKGFEFTIKEFSDNGKIAWFGKNKNGVFVENLQKIR